MSGLEEALVVVLALWLGALTLVVLLLGVFAAPAVLADHFQADCPLTLVATNAPASTFTLSPSGAFRSGNVTLPAGVEMCMPGDNVNITVELIVESPIAMDEGLRFAIREGGRTVGSGVVTKILE